MVFGLKLSLAVSHLGKDIWHEAPVVVNGWGLFKFDICVKRQGTYLKRQWTVSIKKSFSSCEDLHIHIYLSTQSRRLFPGKGQTKQSTSHILQSTFPRSVVKRMVKGFEEDRPQRIVCPPPTPSLHRVCPNRFDAAIKLNCANMALAGLEGNLGAGRGMRRCTANTLIPSSEILRIVKQLQEMPSVRQIQ